MPTLIPKNRLFPLTAEDKTRLQNLAPLFDIEFRKLDGQTFVLRIMSGTGVLEVDLARLTNQGAGNLCRR